MVGRDDRFFLRIRRMTRRTLGSTRRRAPPVLLAALMLLSVLPVTPGAGAPVYSLEVKNPNGGETLVQGQLFDITWTISDTGGYIVLGYSTDSGGTYTRIDTLTNTFAVIRSYGWRVPFGVESTKCRVRVTWVESLRMGATVYAEDVSAADFTIERGAYVRFINETSSMSHGKYYPVKWEIYDLDGTIASLELEHRVRDGPTWGPWESPGARYADIPPELPLIF